MRKLPYQGGQILVRYWATLGEVYRKHGVRRERRTATACNWVVRRTGVQVDECTKMAAPPTEFMWAKNRRRKRERASGSRAVAAAPVSTPEGRRKRENCHGGGLRTPHSYYRHHDSSTVGSESQGHEGSRSSVVVGEEGVCRKGLGGSGAMRDIGRGSRSSRNGRKKSPRGCQ